MSAPKRERCVIVDERSFVSVAVGGDFACNLECDLGFKLVSSKDRSGLKGPIFARGDLRDFGDYNHIYRGLFVGRWRVV